MCTAVTYKTKDSYFGRNLDLEFSYGECVALMPRKFTLPLRHRPPIQSHYAVIGIAHIRDGYPLFYDAVNECGLAMAGLRFTDSAPYALPQAGAKNTASFELIPFVLGTCASLKEARELLADINITAEDYSADLPDTPLHWMLADKEASLVVEWSNTGAKLFENSVGVLTNNPSFDRQLKALNTVTSVPGGLSSKERFARAVHVRKNSVSGFSEAESISQFFHILASVSQTRGCNITDDGLEITVYSSCINLDRGIYYYTTYENSRITAVNMHSEDLDGHEIMTYPLHTAQDIRRIN